MKNFTRKLARPAIAISLMAVLTQGAYAGNKNIDDKIEALQQQLQAQIDDLKKSAQEQAADTAKQVSAIQKSDANEKKAVPSATLTMNGGGPTFSSADGKFSATLTGLGQADFGYYMQGKGAAGLDSAYGPDLSSGTNIRRSAIGIRGKISGDWSYLFLYNFGNSATETPGGILYTYIQYDGLAPWYIRGGVIAPQSSFEDGTNPADLLFIERNSSSNLQRNLAGAEGRDGITIMYAGDRLFGALSYSGGRVQDTAVFDEQMAAVGRLSYMVYANGETNTHLVLGGNLIHIFKLPDSVAGGSATRQTNSTAPYLHNVTLADFPELTVDSTASKLVGTGSLAADHVTSWGLEAAGNWKNFYAQTGYYSYLIDRSSAAYTAYSASNTPFTQTLTPDNNTFSGWYLQGSWVLTGESRNYIKTTGAFGAPNPAHPFSLKDGGWGALEIAARFSVLDLNSHVDDSKNVITGWSGSSKTYTYYNTVRGGDQKIITVGVNWYPNSAIKIALNYLHVDVSRLAAPVPVTTTGTPALSSVAVGQIYDAVALRLQVAF